MLPNIEKWAFIAIIRDSDDPSYDEVIKKSGNGKVLEFRLKIPYTRFRDGSSAEQMNLVFEVLFRSIENMRELGVQTEDRIKVAELLSSAQQELIN